MDQTDIYPTKNKTYLVSELNKEVKWLLSDHFHSIQVEGEISNLSKPSSGHIYFSLKDKNAQIRCALFKSNANKLSFQPENGQQIIVSAQVSLYEPRGDFQLIVTKMQPAGAGNLQLAFEELKKKLMQEGLFDEHLKQPLPSLPSKIGIITSPSGAAIHDALSVLKRRFPSVPVTIIPVTVQGDNAKQEITQAIDTANQKQLADVILLIRGGGSIEDLWAFNEEPVARAISNSKIPIISGIGHDTDFTIADFIADIRAPTPSVAAEHAVPDQNSWLSSFQSLENRLIQNINQRLKAFKQSAKWLNTQLLFQHPQERLHRYAQSLDILESRLVHQMDITFKRKEKNFEKFNALLAKQNPSNQIIIYKQKQQYLAQRLNASCQQNLVSLKHKFHALTQTLNTVSPLATLNRGYSITTQPDSGAVIDSIDNLSINETVKTRLARGEFTSQIIKISND